VLAQFATNLALNGMEVGLPTAIADTVAVG
jgi:hypothetical protein